MFWKIIIIVAVVLLIIDIIKWFFNGIDSAGEELGLSKDQTDSVMNWWAGWHSGRSGKK